MNKLQDILNNILELGTIEQTLLMIALLGVAYGIGSYLGNRASKNIKDCTPYYIEK
tara:strand:+ start:29 stop:196 length:168 start_codon:yes stop_codon:yes gene_type:complete